MRIFSSGKIYDFMRLRAIFVPISLIITFGSIILLFYPGPKLGTDFLGGTELEVGFKQAVDPGEIRKAVTDSGFSPPDVIRVEEGRNQNRFLIRVQEVSSIDAGKRGEIERALCLVAGPGCGDRQATEVKVSPGGDKISVRFRDAPDLEWVRERMHHVSGVQLRPGKNNPVLQNARDNKLEVHLMGKGDQLMAALQKKLGSAKVPDAPLRSEWIGPKAGKLLRDAAIKSIALSIVLIMLYVAFRFDVRFAPGGILALVHDALGTLGIWVILQKEVNLSTIAAVLTVVGYSMNDTVVVYDRVRENLGRLRGATFSHLINVSLSEMMSRTLLTSATVILSLLCFFIWGTGALKDFSLTLVIGLALGTYSSIYVALPLTEWLDKRLFSRMKSAVAKSTKPTATPASSAT
jgi:preprotein translocase subunit SecF